MTAPDTYTAAAAAATIEHNANQTAIRNARRHRRAAARGMQLAEKIAAYRAIDADTRRLSDAYRDAYYDAIDAAVIRGRRIA